MLCLGACSVESSKAEVHKMRMFGEKIGMAFQIKDDLFDYGKQRIENPQESIYVNVK